MAKLGVTPTHKTVDQIKSTILSPSLTPYFEVQFPVPPFLQGLMGGDTDPNKYLTVLCTQAVLPGNNLITFNVDNDYTGVTEQMPHRKVYDQKLNLTFYVNAEGIGAYYPIRFFETYISYIAGEDPNNTKSLDRLRNSNYFYRMTYPDEYMVDSPGLIIKKFEKGEDLDPNTLVSNIDRELSYEFIRTYPTAINSMPVSYGDADVLKCTVTYSYVRYVQHNTFKVDRTEPVRAPRIPSVPEPLTTDTDELVERDIENYGDTVPPGSFGITNSATSAKREVEAQIHKDNAMYGNTWPAGSSSITKPKKVPKWYNLGGLL